MAAKPIKMEIKEEPRDPEISTSMSVKEEIGIKMEHNVKEEIGIKKEYNVKEEETSNNRTKKNSKGGRKKEGCNKKLPD